MKTVITEARLVDGGRELWLQPSDPEQQVGVPIHVTNIDLGFPSVRAVAEDRPGGDGTEDHTAYLGARNVSIDMVLWGNGDVRPPALLDQLRSYCSPRARPWLLYRYDGETSERRMRLRVDGQSAPVSVERRTSIATQASWLCPSGLAEAVDEQTIILSPVVSAPGRTYPRSHPWAYESATVIDGGDPGSGATQAVDGGDPASIYSEVIGAAVNAGNFDAPWVARFYGPLVSPRLENLTTGQRFHLPFGSVGAGQYLEVDVAARTVTIDSDPDVNRFDFVDFTTSSWWPLAPGVNELRFTALGASEPAQAVVTYRDTYL